MVFAGWLGPKFLFQLLLEREEAVVFDDTSFFLDEAVDAALNFRNVLSVDSLAEVHGEAQQHLGVELFTMQDLGRAVGLDGIDEE